ncbi:MAG TPA: GNAT family N-acetyltransferase [Pyrinomonadaceae bacterium]|nr:GNAT family N-acetyltransferase [Pyrinomonadaceae bacterium]
MSETVEIRAAAAEDAEILTKIGWKSFYDAFADHPKNAPDDLKSYMDEAFSLESFSNDLADQDVIYFVAEIAGQMVGYAKLKKNSREDCVSGENPLELCRLYSLNEFIGKGIGKALMLKCLEFAGENAHDFIWLGVWEFNFRAQEFYKKFGFEKCGEHIFQLGTDPQTDWVFQKRI